MSIRSSIVRYCLKSSFKTIGIKPSSAPPVFDYSSYVKPNTKTDATHIVVGPSTITWHTYSTDPREPSTNPSYPDMEAFLHAILKQRLRWACTAYIGSSKETMENLRTGKVKEYLAEQERVETLLESRRDRYFRGTPFSILRLFV